MTLLLGIILEDGVLAGGGGACLAGEGLGDSDSVEVPQLVQNFFVMGVPQLAHEAAAGVGGACLIGTGFGGSCTTASGPDSRLGLGVEGGGGTPLILGLGATEGGAHSVPQFVQNLFEFGCPHLEQVAMGALGGVAGFGGSGATDSWPESLRGFGVEGGGGTPVILGLGAAGGAHSDPQFVQNLLDMGTPH